MDIDDIVEPKVETTLPPESSPPTKKRKLNTVDPIKQILGKSQTYLNQEFVHYYKNVGLFHTESEWEEFSEALYKELPTTFRVTRNTSFTSIIKTYMEELFCGQNIGKYDIGGKLEIDAPRAMEWYPEGLAYHFAASRKSMRLSALTKHLKHFLTHETEIGNISRQEAVSMVPPLLLDVQSHHRVLDMCAAPGSKTCQLLEMLHHDSSHKTPNGFVMANDANMARCYLLAHQTHRLASPAIVVTHYDATQFPLIELAADESTGRPKETLLFDRILCDVPCSGDGTVRKNPGAGSGWDHTKPFKLFKLQLSIAQRAAQLLKVGGRMVYSTCAFNPIEDEAVVAQLLRESKGALRIVDVSHLLPELQRKPGITTWKVMDGIRKTYTSPSDIPEQTRARIPDSVFPPTEAEIANFHLERCLRFYPHLQDTGGFFVAVLEKVAETHFASSGEGANLAELGLVDDAKEPKPERGFSEDPFYSLPIHVAESVKEGLHRYYGIEDVEGEEFRYLLMRSANDPNVPLTDENGVVIKKTVAIEEINMIYKASAPVHELLRRTRGIRFVSAGVRFVENFSKRNKHLKLSCDWRVTAEGLLAVSQYLTRHVVQVGLDDFRALLRLNQPKFEEFSESLRDHVTTLAKDGVGVVAIHLVPTPPTAEEASLLSKRELALRTTPQWVMGWLGKASFTHAIPKLELKSWRNFYLTSDYSFEFDPTINTITDEAKALLIETNRAKKAEREAQRKEANRAEKAKRRNDRRKAAELASSSAPEPESNTGSSDTNPSN